MGIKLTDLPQSVRDAIDKADRGNIANAQPVHVVAANNDPLAKLNKTEKAYARLLESRKRAGEIRDYGIQSITLLLAPDTRYTPDFPVVAADGVIELHEVKGFMRDDALVKFKVAKEKFPWFRFLMFRNHKGSFEQIR